MNFHKKNKPGNDEEKEKKCRKVHKANLFSRWSKVTFPLMLKFGEKKC